MKLLVVKKTFLLLVGIIILLIFVISVGYAFNPVVETFRNSVEYQKAEKQILKRYQALDNRFEFMLPSTWSVSEQAFNGGEIIYHLDFLSKDKKVHGFVQVWDIKKSLKEFIDESKKAAADVIDFKYYRVKEIITDKNKGYLLDYSRKTNQGKYVKAYEAFVQGQNGRIYRVSFFVDEDNWKQQYIVLFNRIIRSLEIHK